MYRTMPSLLRDLAKFTLQEKSGDLTTPIPPISGSSPEHRIGPSSWGIRTIVFDYI